MGSEQSARSINGAAVTSVLGMAPAMCMIFVGGPKASPCHLGTCDLPGAEAPNGLVCPPIRPASRDLLRNPDRSVRRPFSFCARIAVNKQRQQQQHERCHHRLHKIQGCHVCIAELSLFCELRASCALICESAFACDLWKPRRQIDDRVTTEAVHQALAVWALQAREIP